MFKFREEDLFVHVISTISFLHCIRTACTEVETEFKFLITYALETIWLLIVFSNDLTMQASQWVEEEGVVVAGDEGVGGSFILITLFGVFDVVLTATGSSRVLSNVRFYHLVVEHSTSSILRSFRVVTSCLQVATDS